MVYMTPPQLKQLKTFAKASRLSVSQVVREAVIMRIDVENPYNKGFNDGIDCAIQTARDSNGGQIRFPDGRTFADCVADNLKEFKR